MSERLADDVTRDIVAARAELAGRRDQIISEYDERLQRLAALKKQLQDGQLDPRQAENEVRRLLGDRAGVKARGRVGLRPSALMARPMTSEASASGVTTVPKVAATAAKVIAEVEVRLVHVLTDYEITDVLGRLELGFLLHLRKCLQQHRLALPKDAVLMEAVADYARYAAESLADLQEGGAKGIRRLADYVHVLAAQLSAGGGKLNGLRTQLRAERDRLKSDAVPLEAARQNLGALFLKIQDGLDRQWPRQRRTLLDAVR
jgi:hypothetical protein